MGSVEQVLRGLIQAEVEAALSPLAHSLEQQAEIIARLTSALGGMVRRGPGRPRKLPVAPALTVPTALAVPKAPGCGLKGCRKRVRAKGYCASHYQKYRSLKQSGRLPADWVENPAPRSVKNIVLPRGLTGRKKTSQAAG